jgi:hypothetical protein
VQPKVRYELTDQGVAAIKLMLLHNARTIPPVNVHTL